MIGNDRFTPMLVLNSPGPRRLFVPQVPSRSDDGDAKAEMSYHLRMLPIFVGVVRQSANWLENGAFSVAVDAVAVKG
jgi:hypothetical protein